MGPRRQPCLQAQVSPGEGALITVQALTQELVRGEARGSAFLFRSQGMPTRC